MVISCRVPCPPASSRATLLGVLTPDPDDGNSMGQLTRTLPIAAFVFASSLSISCGGSAGTGPADPETPYAANVTIFPGTASLSAVGETAQFTATVRDQRGRNMPGHSVSWNTSDPLVVTVNSSGLATAVADGSATVIAVATQTVSGWATVTVDIIELVITTGSMPTGVVGQPYNLTLEAEGASTPVWSISAGSLPPGLSLEPATGLISGTPTEKGKTTFTVTLASGGQTTARQMSITVVPGDLGFGFGDDQFSLIQPGTFQMGSTNGGADEEPVHEVNITQPFYIQKTEVTQGQWQSVMGTNPSARSSCGDTCPVEKVSWNDVQSFLVALNAANPGSNFRLPTEAEWEYAARAGTTGDYGGTEQADDMGWYSDNSGAITHFVGFKQANAWGLYDMHGNAYEWVQDWHSADYYGVSPADDPTGPLGGTQRVLRGGSANQAAVEARSANRYRATPSNKGFTIYYGFRLARTP